MNDKSDDHEDVDLRPSPPPPPPHAVEVWVVVGTVSLRCISRS